MSGLWLARVWRLLYAGEQRYSDGMHAITVANTVMLLGSALIIAGILSSLVANRFGAPVLLVFLGLGMLAGEDGPGGIQFSNYGLTHLLGSLALTVILFDGGLRTRMTAFRGIFAPSMLLATLGVVITAGLVGTVAFLLFHLGPLESFLLGAVIASTDAAAVFFLLRSGGIQLRHHTGALLEIESGANDPVAVFLTVSAIALITSRGEMGGGAILLSLAEEGVIGGLVGLLGGLTIVGVLNRVNLPSGLYPLLALAGAILTYAVSANAGGSGYLAAYVCGLVVGNRPVRGYASIVTLNDAITWLAQIGMFLGLGLLATPHRFITVAIPALGIAMFLIFVARPVAVWACLSPFGFTWREKTFVSWVGLRGAVSIFLGMMPTLAGLPRASLYFDVAFFVVLVSLLLQGWTTRWAATVLQQVLPRLTAPVQRFEIDLPGQNDVEMVGYPVLPDSRILNVAKMPGWARAALIVRDKEILEPATAGKLQAGDYAYYLAPALRVSQLDGLFAPIAERGAAEDCDCEFEIHGSTPLGLLSTMYDFDLSGLNAEQTLARLFAERFDNRAEIGDAIPVGNCILTVRTIENDDVAEVGLRFDEEPKPNRLDRALNKLTDNKSEEALTHQRLITQVAEEILHHVAALFVMPGPGEIRYPVEIRGDIVGGCGGAQTHAFALLKARSGEDAGGGRHDHAGRRVFARQIDDRGRNEFGLEQRQHVGRHQIFGHAGRRDRAHGIDLDIVARAFELERVHQTDKAKLGGAVIGLAEIAVQAGGGCRHDDAAIFLVAENLPQGPGGFDGAHDMDIHHRLEILQFHFGEAFVAQDAGIGDQDIDPAEGIHGLFDQMGHAGIVADRGAIGDGFAARRLDFGDHRFGSRAIAAGAVERAAQIVDHHLGAAPRQFEGVAAAQPTARAGDNGDLTVEANGHGILLKLP